MSPADKAAEALAPRLGHCFTRPDLLAQALTHPSVDQGRRRTRSTEYERLEFLGDRVLGLVVADMLFRRFPDEAEGELARRFTALVRREAVARVAQTIGLDERLILARGDDEAGARSNPGLLADACEAVIGALFADGGFAVADRFVREQWASLMEEDPRPPKDAKTALQEWAQARGRPLPAYRLVKSEGPAHHPDFLIEVEVDGEAAAQGRGTSKRAAEQAAARALMDKVGQ
jgi:ribonuclease-3